MAVKNTVLMEMFSVKGDYFSLIPATPIPKRLKSIITNNGIVFDITIRYVR